MKKFNKIFAISVACLFLLSFIPLDAFAKGGGGFSGGGGRSFGGGGHSFGGGSKSFSSPSPSRSYSTPSVPRSPSPSPSRQFSAPSTPREHTAVKPPPQPKSNINSEMARGQRMEESKKQFQTQPKPKTDSYQHKPSYNDLKQGLNYQKMENRSLRQQQTLGGYYNHPAPTVVYHDNFNIFFWLWLLNRPTHERDTWAYNHRDQMDPARYEELKRNDKEMERRLQELERQGVKKDSSYVPAGIDRDLMYSDEHVKKAYEEKTASGFPWLWVFVGLALAGCVYLVFYAKLFRKRGR